jgi:hypothetical protein
MAKDPAFLFYPGDYLRDTQCLSEQAQTAYDRIMCEHMRNICISQEQLNFFTKRLTPDQKSEVLMVLTKVSGGYQIAWVAESIEKRRNYSDSRRKNRKSKPKKKETYVPHMENENENEIESINTNKKLSKSEIESDLFNDAIFVEQMQMTHKGKDIKQAWNECWNHHSTSPSPPRESWEWRQKLNTWLSIKSNNNGKTNGTPKYFDKDKLARLINERHGITGTGQ